VPLVPLYGHLALRERLAGSAERGALPASLLLHGPRGVGKQRLALWLAKLLLCTGTPQPCGRCQSCRFAGELTHPDLHWVYPRPRLKDADVTPRDVEQDYAEATAERVAAHGLYAPPSGSDAIFVATVRAIVQQAAVSPAIGRRKVFVVGDAERMVPQEGAEAAANAFLKLLEEPPANTTLILTSSEPGALLPTIRSRVVGVRVAPLPERDVRDFLADATVAGALDADRAAPRSVEDRLRVASGAPGALFGGGERAAAMEGARRLLDAATADRATRFRAAFAQGSAKARGAFTDTLDALTVLLHARTREALARSDARAADGAARAMDGVERAKGLAAGNVSPSLVTAALLRELGASLRTGARR
jgi:DNA polymerase-3 subunit delta'